MMRNRLSDSAERNPRGRLRSAAGRERRRLRPIVIELLENRALLSAYMVNDLADAAGSSTDVTLRYAITEAEANPGSTIDFSVTGTIALGSALPELSADVTIIGPGASSLTIMGGGSEANFSIVTVDSTATVSLSGLTLSDGSGGYGGGIQNDGTLTVADSTFSGNSASSGGAIVNGGSLTVTGSTFSGNSATGENGIGGAIYDINNGSNTSVTVTGSTFSDNTAGVGGAIGSYGTLTITSSTFSNNSAGSGGGGGGIAAFGALTMIASSTFSGNSAAVGGGIENYQALIVTDSTFAGNTASDDGGGIATFGTATITDSTLSGNSASGKNAGGGGISNGDTLTLGNTIVAGNTAQDPGAGGGPDIYGACMSEGNNLIGVVDDSTSGFIGSDLTGTTADPLDPELGPLANNGGQTETMALLPDSPAIGAGNTALVPPGENDDQRGPGYARSADGYVDIGAFERQVITVTDAGDTAGSSTDVTLRYAIAQANAAPGSTIHFGVTGTIMLGSALPELSTDVTITGPGASSLSIEGGGSSSSFSILTVDSGVTAVVADLTLADGQSTNGGGIQNYGTLTVTGSTFFDNAGYGGGIENQGTLTVSGCTFANNSGYSGGGISNKGTLTVSDSTFSDNSADNAGGGIYTEVELTVTDSTFWGNTAGNDGGGIANSVGTIAVIDSTVAGNSATYGGGIANGRSLTLGNTIVAGNMSTPGNGPDVTGPVASLGNNLIGATDASGFGYIGSDLTGTVADPLDPLLGPLADNGGPTETMALLPASPAIGAGSTMVVPVGQIDDQRGPGYPRIIDDTVDVGAYELLPVAPAITLQPLAQRSDVGASVTFVAAATGSPTPTVQWEVSPGASAPYIVIPGATSPSLVLSDLTASMNNNRYEAVFTNSANSMTTNAALLTVISPPTANGQTMDVPFGTADNIVLSGSDLNSPPLTLSFTIVSGPAHGMLSGIAPYLIYTPDTGYHGVDGITFTVSNGTFTSSNSTITLDVQAGTPTATGQTVIVAENSSGNVITLSGSDPDLPALSLTYSLMSEPAHGIISGAGANLTYTPESGYHGADSFTFVTSNGTMYSQSATIVVNVAAAAQTVTAPPPMIIGESPIFSRKLNKKGKPVGKAVLTGFALAFSEAMGSSASSDADYTLQEVVAKATKKKPLKLSSVGTQVSYSASDDTVNISFTGTPAFTNGGLLTISDRLASAAGALFSGTGSFLIGKAGKAISP